MKLPTITVNPRVLARLDDAAQHEWLVTNGLGGYASATINGLHTRKYHGLLVAALKPPGDRTVCLAKLDEDVIVGDRILRLGVNEFHNYLFPDGHLYLKEFSLNPLPHFTYVADSVTIKKTEALAYGKNLAVILYNVQNHGPVDAKVRVYPLVTCRHFHTVINHLENPPTFSIAQDNLDVKLNYVAPQAEIILRSTAGQFVNHPAWVEALHYREEDARGESDTDDCYQPGYYELTLAAGDEMNFGIAAAASTISQEAADLMKLAGYTYADFEQVVKVRLDFYSQFLDHFYELYPQIPVSDWLNWILMASDSFIVNDKDEKRSVIAGYFWFEPWGRDTFISLPGLMLVTHRFQDARYVLLNFSQYCRRGLIPNIILDKSGRPLYNTVDGTLWYINAVLQYLKYTGDLEFVQTYLWNTLKTIIAYHEAGTDYDIKMDSDGLLSHGSRLTWMDACIQGEAVTPRDGKAVEIQALWYNALQIMGLLACKFGEPALAQKYASMAEKAKASFRSKFWDKERNCLFDVIKEPMIDLSLRPNQIIAVSLDYTMLDEAQNKAIVDLVQREFLTTRGLRTLSRSDPRYKHIYTGIMSMRDQAYHNGAVWPWLFGPFIRAYFKANDHTETNTAFISKNVIQPLFEQQLLEGGLGTVNEIFDGDPPHAPRGCIAQAWSVAEPLRAYVEDVLQIRPRFERNVLGQK
jgi:predicted glycogen debranching enzyme